MVTIKNFFKKASSDENKEKLLPNDYDERKGCCNCFSPLNDKFTSFFNNLQDFAKKAIEMGRNDPRKIIFSLKMGFALSFVSLLIFWKKPNDIAQFAIWAILTVLVMFEFSIGATLIKGFNRGLGTFCAGMLAFIFAQLALWAGERERVVIVVSIFIVAFFGSYLKLYPTMAPYEYGYRVFILTYCILIVAGNRTREYNVAICTRLALIALGAGICLLINISIYPIWSGEDLHRLVVKNFMDLANSLEGCINGYLSCVEHDRDANDSEYNGYKSVIESTGREQTLLGFAIWEPPHGRYRMHKNLWRDFVKLSSALRHCAFMVMALHGCIQSEIQSPPEKRKVFRNELKRVGANAAKVLRELGTKLEKLEMLDSHGNILKEVHETAQQLQKKIDHKSYILVNSKSWEIGKPNINHEDSSSENGSENLPLSSRSRSLSETAIDISSLQANWPQLAKESSEFRNSSFRKQNQWPSRLSLADGDIADTCEMETYLSASSLSLATFASLLIEFVARLQNVVDNFEELSQRAEFKEPDVIIPPRGQFNDEAVARERPVNEEFQIYLDGRNGKNSETQEDLAAESPWDVKEERSENQGLSADHDPLLESIFTLQAAQDKLEREIQKFKDIGIPSDFDSDDNPGLSTFQQSESRNGVQHSFNSLESEVVSLKQNVILLQNKLNEEAYLLKLKEARVTELEAILSSNSKKKEKKTGNDLHESSEDIERDLEGLFMQNFEAEIEYLVISRTIQTLRAAAIDQVTLLEEQKILATEQAQMVKKLGDSETKTAMLKSQAESLANYCDDVASTNKTRALQKGVCKYSSYFLIQLVLLVIVFGLYVLQMSPDAVEVVPT